MNGPYYKLNLGGTEYTFALVNERLYIKHGDAVFRVCSRLMLGCGNSVSDDDLKTAIKMKYRL